MTETGSTVERLRELQAKGPGNWEERWEVYKALPALLAVVEAAQEFAENCLDRCPAPLLGDGREQPDNVWFVGSANPLGLHLLDALRDLHSA